MFKNLNDLRNRVESINLVLSFKTEGKISVMVIPQVKSDLLEKSPELATPFSLTGTPTELDAQFALCFEQYRAVTLSLQQQAELQIEQIKQSEKAKSDQQKAKAATPKTVKPASSSPKADEEDEDQFDLSAEDLF